MRKMSIVKKSLIILLLLNCFYVIFMIVANLIPYSSIESHAKEALEIIVSEGDYPIYTYDNPGATINNFTDRAMITYMQPKSDNVLKTAMVEYYPRYWYGHQAIWKPLFSIFDLYQIRYINMHIFWVCAFFMLYQITKKLGLPVAFVTLFSFVASYFFVLSQALSSMCASILLFLSVGILLCKAEKWSRERIYIFFLIVGSLENFFVGLGRPLLTFGLMFLYYFLLLYRQTKIKAEASIKELIKLGIIWWSAYGLTWVFKWIIGSFILQKNILIDAVNQAEYRISGNVQEKVDYLKVYKWNIWTMFKPFIIIAIIVGIIWFLLFLFYRKEKIEIINLVPLFIIAVCPYVWYLFMANHSEIHFWSTYRLQILTIIAGSCFIYYSIDWKKFINQVKKY